MLCRHEDLHLDVSHNIDQLHSDQNDQVLVSIFLIIHQMHFQLILLVFVATDKHMARQELQKKLHVYSPKLFDALAAIINWLTAHSCLAFGLPLTSGAAKPSNAVS